MKVKDRKKEIETDPNVKCTKEEHVMSTKFTSIIDPKGVEIITEEWCKVRIYIWTIGSSDKVKETFEDYLVYHYGYPEEKAYLIG